MRVSAHDIDQMITSIIPALSLQGIQPGERICLSAPNSPALLATVCASLNGGVVPVVLSSLATEREIDEISSDVGARVVLRGDHISEFMTQELMTQEFMTLNSSGSRSSRQLPKCRPMHVTSGTSGRPKAVWSGWLDEKSARAWIDDEVAAWGITASDVHLVCGPLSHSAPLRFALMTLWAGGSVIVPPKFDAATFAQLLPSVTTTFMAPTHMQRVMEYSRGEPVPNNLRLLAHAGAACPDRVRLWAYETFGTDVVTEFYGSTEGQFTVCTADEWLARPGTVGRARPGRAMRVDDDGRLWCQAPDYVRFEYWGDPQKTSSSWDGEWFTVGDYGRIDEDGYVYLEGRKGDLIITGGVNVYPAEIERVLTNLPGVEQVVAFGLPDEQWGQRVCVAVVGSVSEAHVREFAAKELAGPKRPKTFFMVNALPQTHSGKIDRSAVLALFA